MKQTKEQPAIDAICKMAIIKEAVASCALDGETQCGDMTIEPQTKETMRTMEMRISDAYQNGYEQGKAQALKQVKEIIEKEIEFLERVLRGNIKGVIVVIIKHRIEQLKAELEKLK